MVKHTAKSVVESRLSDFYGEGFYKSQMDGSYKSASKYVGFLWKVFQPRSVVDVGCGRGTWLKAFKDKGVENAVGFDGNWNRQDNMIDQSIKFVGVDLNKPIAKQDEKYDLAISLEVAEHLEESSANIFVDTLTKLADVVIFSAAYTKQGGTHHINEKPHTYWAKIFREYDYIPYDLFRPVFWGDADIEFWYQQNTFLYVKSSSELNRKLTSAGHQS